MRAALESCALADRSDLSRLLARGPDFLGLLHRLSTGDVATLAEGEGRPTVLTTPKGRIVERLFVHHLGKTGVLCVAGPGSAARVLDHLKRFTFAERTGLEDMSDRTFQAVLVGPRAGEVLERSGGEPPGRFHARAASIGGHAVQLLGQDGMSGEGFSITGEARAAGDVWRAVAASLAHAGGRPAGDEPLEAWRVLRGLPAPGHELTGEHNPLEAGQWDAVSFDKGCYVGQEVVARLRTYDKISRSVVGLELPEGAALPAVGTRLHDAGRPVGEVTSAVEPPGRSAPVALAYVKRRVLRPGLELQLGEGGMARVVELPFDG